MTGPASSLPSVYRCLPLCGSALHSLCTSAISCLPCSCPDCSLGCSTVRGLPAPQLRALAPLPLFLHVISRSALLRIGKKNRLREDFHGDSFNATPRGGRQHGWEVPQKRQTASLLLQPEKGRVLCTDHTGPHMQVKIVFSPITACFFSPVTPGECPALERAAGLWRVHGAFHSKGPQ